MKKWDLKTILGLGIGLVLGNVIYDYFAHDSINWIRAIFAGILVVIMMVVFQKIKSEKR